MSSIEHTDKGHDDEHGRLTVAVHDEDSGGDPLRFRAGPGEKVSKVMAELYNELGVPEADDDRLLCLATGEPVKPYRHLHLREYAAGQCAALVWTYARGTGGA
jgi:hypothetical protein